jgi:hypothetical protein
MSMATRISSLGRSLCAYRRGFYLRLLAVLSFAAVCLWGLQTSWRLQSEREFRTAIQLEHLGASVLWEWRLGAGTIDRWAGGSQRAPSRIVPGDEFVEGVYLPLCRVPQLDQKLECLKSIAGLRYLNLAHAAITDAALAHLAGLSRLEWLDLHDTPISDAGLQNLGSAVRLEWLNLGHTPLTDASLPILATFQRLKRLNLADTRITANRVAALREQLPAAQIDFDERPISQAWDSGEGLTLQESISVPSGLRRIAAGPRAMHEWSRASNSTDVDQVCVFPMVEPTAVIMPVRQTR